MRRWRSLWPAVAVLLMSCSGASMVSDDSIQDYVSPATSLPTTTYPVTTLPETTIPTTTLPDTVAARCGRLGVRVIKEFVAAFNTGGIDLDPYFASAEEFMLFGDEQRSSAPHPNPLYDAEDRSTLIAYLNEVRRTRGPIAIRRITFNYGPRFDQSMGYGIELYWGRGNLRFSKASVRCDLGQIEAWGIGRPYPFPDTSRT